MKTILFTTLSLTCAPLSQAAVTAYYSVSGVGGMGAVNAATWGGVDNTNKSAAQEVIIDYTSTMASETNPIILWDAGGSGTGSVVVIDEEQIHFFAGNSTSHVVSGNHGLTAGLTDVQIVTAFEINAGSTTASDEVLSIYVNGVNVASGEFNTSNDWAGGETGSELGQASGTQRYNGTGLFTTGDVISYPETNISFNAYLLASAGGPADNTLGNIVVAIPEPSSSLMLLVGSAGLLLRRRR